MAGSTNRINAIKLNVKIKQYLGWFLAVMFPFTAKGIMDATRIPMMTALIYWLICGILLRYILEKRLPYFRPKFRKVAKEILLLAAVTLVSAFLYRKNIVPFEIPLRELILNTLLFAFINGFLEHLVWVNIYDLAGSRIKLAGFIASFIFSAMIHVLYWSKFTPLPVGDSAIFLLCKGLMFIIGIYIYHKTEDLTIWSVQHIIYNLYVVYLGGFGINMFIHI